MAVKTAVIDKKEMKSSKFLYSFLLFVLIGLFLVWMAVANVSQDIYLAQHKSDAVEFISPQQNSNPVEEFKQVSNGTEKSQEEVSGFSNEPEEQIEITQPIERDEEETDIVEEHRFDKVAYLTIDDGPSQTTEEILDILQRYEVAATFFMLDGNMKKYADSVQRTVMDGHAVGVHGVTHDKKQFYRSTDSVLNELNTSRATLKEITGIDTVLIRTPFGSSPHMTPTYKQAVADAGFIMWDWNVDSLDWKYRDERFVLKVKEQVEKLEETDVSPVILLHDRAYMPSYLPEIIQFLQERGYELKPLDETIEAVVLK